MLTRRKGNAYLWPTRSATTSVAAMRMDKAKSRCVLIDGDFVENPEAAPHEQIALVTVDENGIRSSKNHLGLPQNVTATMHESSADDNSCARRLVP